LLGIILSQLPQHILNFSWVTNSRKTYFGIIVRPITTLPQQN
jgi:hypothetical protein